MAKCTKFDFRWAFDPDPARGIYRQRSPDPVVVFKGPTRLLLSGREGKGKEMEGNERGGTGMEKGEGGAREKCDRSLWPAWYS